MIIGVDKAGTFDQDFYEFMCSRQDAVDGLLFSNKDYIQLNKEEAELFEKIKELIPEELFEQLDTVTNEIFSIEKSYVYRQGFLDGLRMPQTLNEQIEESDQVKAFREKRKSA